MYSVQVMGPVWGEVNKAASLAFTSNLQRNSDISRRKRQLCERFVRCEQKKLPTVSAFSCHAMRIALKPTFLVCRKTGTLPQIRQCHAGTLIYAIVIRLAIAIPSISSATFGNLRASAGVLHYSLK